MEKLVFLALLIVGVVFLLRFLRAREEAAFRETDTKLLAELRAEVGGEPEPSPAPMMAGAASAAADAGADAESAAATDTSYQRRPQVFDDIHRHVLVTLEAVAGDRYRLLSGVALTDFIRAADDEELFRMRARRIPYLLAERRDFAPVCGVALKTASTESQAELKLLEAVFGSAGIPLVVLPLVGDLSIEEVRDALGEHLSEAPRCDQCGKTMAVRSATKGRNAGRRFWVCSGFPGCKAVVPIAGR